MQTDLISRSAEIDRIAEFLSLKGLDEWEVMVAIREILENAPAVDAVPVIRCKDCKHRGGYHCPMYHTETSLDDLDGFDDYNVDKTDGDGFCHRGEKKG